MPELESAALPVNPEGASDPNAVTETTLRGEIEKLIYQSEDDAFSF